MAILCSLQNNCRKFFHQTKKLEPGNTKILKQIIKLLQFSNGKMIDTIFFQIKKWGDKI